MDKLRFCLIGTGRAGLVHARNLAWRIPTAELAAVCDTNEETLQKVQAEFGVAAAYSDYREACSAPDIDAVVIVTPTFLHRIIACAAANNGKHVFLEKPMAITAEECEAINEAVSKAGVKLQLAFMRRFDEGFMRAKEIVDSGEMGRIMTIKSTGRGPGLPPPWIYDIDKSNGILAEVNSHDIDSLRWFTGREVQRVFAEGINVKCLDAVEDYPDFYDNAIISVRFEDDILGVVDGTCPCHYGYDARVEVLCEKGVVFVGSAIKSGVSRVMVDDMEVTGVGTAYGDNVRSWRNLFKDAYLAEMEHFIACIKEDRQPRVTGEDGLRAVEVVQAANMSIRNHAPVELQGSLVS